MWGLLTAVPGFLNGLLTYLNKKQDDDLVRSGYSKDVAISVVQSETARQSAHRDLLAIAMGHPIWWFAWGLGVFPVMLYYASIFWVSTFPFWGWTVLKAPADALEFAKLVVGSLFGIAGASTLVAGLVHAWTKRA